MDRSQDDNLRRAILQVLYLANGKTPTGFYSGNAIKSDAVDDVGFEDDSHFLRLCRDLVGAGLADQKFNGNRPHNGSIRPEHVSFRISFKGTQLFEQKIPPIPGIADPRAIEE